MVVTRGLTVMVEPVTGPMPGPMLKAVEPVTDQVSVVDWPRDKAGDAAWKLAMTGGLRTATVAMAVTVP